MTEQDVDWLGDVAASERDILGRGGRIAHSLSGDSGAPQVGDWPLEYHVRESGEVWMLFESGVVAAHDSWAAKVQRMTGADQR